MKMHIGTVACLVFVLHAQFGESQEQSPPLAQDLSGKWEGSPPLGGRLEIDMKVSPSGEIEGKGLIRGGGSKAAYPHISGEVKGQKVFIRTVFPIDQTTVIYRCVWKERDTLECVAGNGFRSTFKRQ
jgi:hypothetical protein